MGKNRVQETLHGGCYTPSPPFTYVYVSLDSHLCIRLKKSPKSAFRRPAVLQALPSLETRASSLPRDGVSPSNTIPLRCFRNSHKASMMMALTSFSLVPCIRLLRIHSGRVSCGVGVHCGIPKAWQISTQKVLAKTHCIIMWFIVSSPWLQSGHDCWCGSPLLAKRSEVQHLLRIASHVKKRHCRGARHFHVASAVGTSYLPMNLAAYADRAE